MRNFLTTIVLLFAGISLTAQTQQSLCHQSNQNRGNASNCWAFNLNVTDPAGITLRSIQVYTYLGSVQNQMEGRIYVRNGGPIQSTNDLLNSSLWTLRRTTNSTQTSNHTLDFPDLYFAPGTHGVMLYRDGWLQKYVDGLQSVSGSGVTMTAVGHTGGLFEFPRIANKTFAGCFNYTSGSYTATVRTVASGALPFMSVSPADLNGNSRMLGGFTYEYPAETPVQLSTPARSGGNHFDHWEIDGVPYNTRTPTILAENHHRAVAKYFAPVTLTIAATLDGVVINPTVACSPNDLDNRSSVIATGMLSFQPDQAVELTRPASIGDRAVFKRWMIDGVPQTNAGNALALSADFDKIIVAEYETVSCYEPNLGTRLAIGDNDIQTQVSLGFDFPMPAGGTTNAVAVCSEGYVLFDPDNTTIEPDASAGLYAGPGRIAAFWRDLAFSNGDGIYVDTSEPGRAVITWNRAHLPGSVALFTVQLRMFASGQIMLSYSGSLPTDSTMTWVGIGPGNSIAPAAIVDLTSSWDSGSLALATELFWGGNLASDLEGRLVTAWPNGSGGYAGAAIDTGCAMGSSQTYGSGCPTAAAFYDLSTAGDLSDKSFTLAPNAAGGYDVSPCTTNCYDSVLGSAITIGDDETQTVQLPFLFPSPGNGFARAIQVCSNGYVWVDGSTDATFTPNVQQFLDRGSRLAPLWIDLNPTAAIADGVYVKVESQSVVITWHRVPEFQQQTTLTVQCAMHADGTVTFSYVGDTTTVSDALVGFSPGRGTADPGSIDLATAAPFSTSAPGSAPLGLDIVSGWAPVIGQPLRLEVSNIANSSTAGALFLGGTAIAQSLSAFGAPGCSLLVSVDATVPFAISGTTMPLEFPVSADPTLVGAVWNAQVATIDPRANALGVTLSNGIALTFGER